MKATLASLFAALICVNPLVAIAQSDELMPGAKYSATWTRAGITSTTHNPGLDRFRHAKREMSLGIAGEIALLEVGKVFSLQLGNAVSVSKVVDEAGDDITAKFTQVGAIDSASFYPLLYAPVHGKPDAEWIPQPCTIGFQLTFQEQLPRKLKSVRGSIRAIVAREITHVDVPFKPSDTPFDIVPGWRGRLTEASVKPNGQFEFNFMRVDDPRQRYEFDGQIKLNEQLLPSIVTRVIVLTDKGLEAHVAERAFRFPNPRNCSGFGQTYAPIKTIRFEIATDPAIVELPFELNDIALTEITLPSFEK